MEFQVENANTADDHDSKSHSADDQPSQVQPNTTDSITVSNPESIAAGTLRLAICDATKITECFIGKELKVLTSATI